MRSYHGREHEIIRALFLGKGREEGAKQLVKVGIC